jgi:hypothetical protein
MAKLKTRFYKTPTYNTLIPVESIIYGQIWIFRLPRTMTLPNLTKASQRCAMSRYIGVARTIQM